MEFMTLDTKIFVCAHLALNSGAALNQVLHSSAMSNVRRISTAFGIVADVAAFFYAYQHTLLYESRRRHIFLIFIGV